MGKRDACLKSVEHQEHVPGLIFCNLGACRRWCNVKAGVATRLLSAEKAPLEGTCNFREWLNHLETPLLSEGACRIFLTGKEAYGDSAPNEGSSVDCLEWRWIQASHPAAAWREITWLLREKSERSLLGEQNRGWSKLSLGHICHPLNAEALWDHIR